MRREQQSDLLEDTAVALSPLIRWGIPLLLALAAVLVATVHVPQHDKISPIDEYAYIDYLAKVPDQGIVRQGEETGDFARRYLLCHGVAVYENYNPDVVNCQAANGTVNDDGFPHGGLVTTDIYTPIYFGVAWAVARVLDPFGIELVDGARLSGALWLALAGVLLYVGAMRLGATRSAAMAVSLMMIASPLAFWSNTYVSTDATALFAGSLMLVLGLGVVRGAVRPAFFVLASVFVTLLKIQNFVAVGALVLTFLLVLLSQSRGASEVSSQHRGRLLRTSALAIIAAIVAEGAWVVLRAALSVGDTPDQGVSSPWSASRLFLDGTLFFPGSMDTVDSAQDSGQLVVAWLLKLLIVGGVLSAVFSATESVLVRRLALSALIVSILAAPVLALLFQAFTGSYVIPVSRYGAALTPLYLAAGAILLSRRPYVGQASLIVAVVVFAFSLVTFG